MPVFVLRMGGGTSPRVTSSTMAPPPPKFRILDRILLIVMHAGPYCHLHAHISLLFRAKRGLYSDSIEVCMASLRVSKTSFLVGTRTLALSTGASVSDIRGLQIYSLGGLDSPCWSMFA